MKTPPILWIPCIMALCVGCETVPQTSRVTFTREHASSVKTIGVVRPTNPEKIHFVHPKALGTALAFGVVGILVAGPAIIAQQNREAETFEQQVGTPNRNLDEWMGKALEAELSRNGYAVKVLGPPPRKPGMFLTKYDSLTAGVDAILDMRILGFGFVKDPSRSVFVPWISAPVQLVTADGKTTLFRDWPIYGPDFSSMDEVFLPAAKRFYFQDFDAILAKPDLAIEGLKAAVTNIAAHIGERLKPHSSGIYFFRKGTFNTGSVFLKVEVDGKVVGYLPTRQSLYVGMMPGRHKIRTSGVVPASATPIGPQEGGAEVDLESGKDIYVQAECVAKFASAPKFPTAEVSETEGKMAIDRAMKPMRAVTSSPTGK